MSAVEYQAMRRGRARAPRPKYGNRKTVVDGIAFDSKAEARRWQELRYMEVAGRIRDLRRQVPIPLEGRDGPIRSPKGRQLVYRADFVYVEAETGATVVEDAKGYETKDYKLKRAILAAQGVEIREVRR